MKKEWRIRWISSLILVSICVTPIAFFRSFAAVPATFSLSKAVSVALANSAEMRQVKNDGLLKKIELQQAIEAIRDIRRKESTVKFSMLFKLQWPTGHGLPKEIDLLMKVPKLQSEIMELQRKLEDTQHKTILSAETAFFDVIEQEENLAFLKKQFSSDKESLQRLQKELLMGLAKKEDLDKLKKKVDQLEKDIGKNSERLENGKKKLSEVCAVDVSQRYFFNRDFYKVVIERNQLKDIKAYALDRDFTVFKAASNRKVAETEVATLRNIYNNRWRSKVGVIERDIAKGGLMDYDAFLNKYNEALTNIERPHTGYYRIRIIFFTIKIPKDWFRKEFDGIRYFEDQKYALYISLMERDKAIKEEEDAKKNFLSSLDNSYNALMELWSAYQQTKAEVVKAKMELESLSRENLRGNASFTDVEDARSNLYSMENTLITSLAAYNKNLSAFDRMTSGAVSSLRKGVKLKTDTYAAGLSYPEESRPSWFLETPIDQYQFLFGVRSPANSELKITDFELYTENDIRIGSKVPVNQTISHLPLTYGGSTTLKIKLYEKDQLRYISEVEATDLNGLLDIKPVDSKGNLAALGSGTVVGNWNVKKNTEFSASFRGQFLFPSLICYYGIETADGINLGEPFTPVAEAITHLGISFAKPETLTIRLYDAEKKPLGAAEIVGGEQPVIKMK